MKKNVAIVGAGAAGLMAAVELRDAGHDVQVFESRDRVGGRIHTVRFEDGRFANAGAEWLNSSDAAALSLIERYRLPLAPNCGFEANVDEGRPLSSDATYPILDEAFSAAVDGLTDLDEPWNDPAARELDRLSIAEWAFRTGADAGTIRRFIQDNEGEFMSSATEISMAGAALSSVLTNNDRAYRLRDGTACLPEALAEDVGDAVRLSERVVAVHEVNDEVKVLTEQGESSFDAVILALPLPILRRIELDPELDVPWIAQGRGGKYMIPYDNAEFGGATRASFGTAIKFLYANAAHQSGDGTILTAYSLQTLSGEEVAETFSTWFPELVASDVKPIAKYWDMDPDSGTTYSAPQPGYLDSLRRLREPQSRVVFAGEHTEILFGYVESALVSGRRAARLVAQS